MSRRDPCRSAAATAGALATVALAAIAPLTSAFAQTCHLEWAPMRDGVRLATEVYLPDGRQGPFPVVLQRTPYNRSPAAPAGASSCNNAAMRTWAASGYAALNQDVRGRYRSEGVMDAMQQEVDDGYDAVEWAGTQPWSSGKVGTLGGSYVGLTQWQPAKQAPPHLAAIAPAITASDYHDHWTYVNGVFDLWFAQSWMLVTFAGEQVIRDLEAQGLPPDQVRAGVAAWLADGRARIQTEWNWQLPLTSFEAFRGTAPYYYDWLDHPSYDAFWARLDLEAGYGDVQVPALNSGGWYDIFQVGTVRNFQGMRAEGGTPQAREGTKLVMNCCGHASQATQQIHWGPARTDPGLTLRFFDRYLKGIDNGWEEEPGVHLDVLVPPDTGTAGSSFLLTADAFPLPGTEYVSYHLASGGRANTRHGDGELVTTPGKRANGNPDRFTYDPADPVPTVGGNMCCGGLIPNGAQDQATVELRDDVLVYTSAPLEADLAVIGPVSVTLWAKSSAPDTDFTAKLVDVHLDGMAHNVLDRIVRARFRWGSKLPPSLIEPGKPYEYRIDLGNAGTIFRKGHRIRLEISSSNFPHYARNLNTGHSNETTAAMAPAMQTILHDPVHASRLVLPVVPGVQAP
ncbi:MAG TPA: CocE/NonD family hydrolase [Anaeromyxobacteraceae bacterium]|nr:CocE/NonD family hydrolase [Anaeromyxobacteraceae bacterium]